MARNLLEEEFKRWKESKGTEAINLYLYKYLEDLRSQWEAGLLQASSPLKTAIANGGAIEKAKFIREFLELDYDQYMEVMTDGEYQAQKRAESSGESGSV